MKVRAVTYDEDEDMELRGQQYRAELTDTSLLKAPIMPKHLTKLARCSQIPGVLLATVFTIVSQEGPRDGRWPSSQKYVCTLDNY